MRQESAEVVGMQALAWLVASDELLPVFLGATGAHPQDLRAGAEDPVYLGAVLDFVLMDDAWVLAFCAESGLAPESVARARAALPGGDAAHWT